MLRRTLGSFLLVAVLAFAAYAVDPASTPPDEPEPVRTRQADDMMDASQSQPGASAPFPRQFVMGKVTDIKGSGMAGTGVKLFADGEIIESAQTGSSGDFELDLPLNIETDETVVLWFVPSTDRYVMQSVVLKMSTVARQTGLFSRCTNQVAMLPQMRVDVSLMTEDEAVASVKARDCF